MRSTLGIALVGAISLVAACSKSEPKADSAAIADSVAKATVTKPDSTATPANPTLTDANIAAILDQANAADSSVGKLASEKGTSADVKDFGKMMMRDHHALRKAGQDLAKKLNLTPAMPAGDTSAAAAQRWQDNLTSMPKGADWDKAYIDHEVVYHQAVLQTATAALGAAQDTSLKGLIQRAAPNIQAHLDKAKSIQSKLSAAPAAAPAAAPTKKKKG